MHLGIALTFEETERLAGEMGIVVSGRNDGPGHYFALRDSLSIACGIERPGINLVLCDSFQYPLVYALVSNYDLRPNLSTTFEKMVEIVRKVFGPSRDVEWWLDLTVNHDSQNYLVSDPPRGNVARYG